MAYGVLQEIGEDTHERKWLAQGNQAWFVRYPLDHHSAGRTAGIDDTTIDNVPDIDGFRAAAGKFLAELQVLSDQVVDVLDILHGFSDQLRIGSMIMKHLERQAQTRQRCAQVMGDPGKHGGPVSQQVVDLQRHAVEGSGKCHKLRGPCFRQWRGCPAGTKLTGGGRKLRKWPDETPNMDECSEQYQGNGTSEYQGSRQWRLRPTTLQRETETHHMPASRNIDPVKRILVPTLQFTHSDRMTRT